MTPFRQRFIDDLRLRNMSPRTIETYVLRVRQFAQHFGRAPDLLGHKELRAYQQHLIARGLSWSTFNQTVCALRFLYQVTLGRPAELEHLPFAKRPRRLPTVLSPAEVVQLLKAAASGRDLEQFALGWGGIFSLEPRTERVCERSKRLRGMPLTPLADSLRARLRRKNTAPSQCELLQYCWNGPTAAACA